jgi:hypothetical protein
MNELRRNYKSFEAGLKDYVASFMAAEKDFGNHCSPTEKEMERLRGEFRNLWEAEDSTMEEAEFRY